ncbi:MAG: GH3 auxin-responsive promoter family protein, partial [Candidatus Hodarchaeota archaeon]
IGRKGRVVNLAGEKITDTHVSNAMAYACRKTGGEVVDYTVVGSVNDGIPSYTLAVMFRDDDTNPLEFALSFEEAMMESNYEFRHSREMGALGATTILKMKTSHFDDILIDSLQAKPISLTTDLSILAKCEAF